MASIVSLKMRKNQWCYLTNNNFGAGHDKAIRSVIKSSMPLNQLLTNSIPPQSQRQHAQNAALSTLVSPLKQRLPPLAIVKPTLKQCRLQQCTAKDTPLYSIFSTFCARCRNSAPSSYRSRNAPVMFWR